MDNDYACSRIMSYVAVDLECDETTMTQVIICLVLD